MVCLGGLSRTLMEPEIHRISGERKGGRNNITVSEVQTTMYKINKPKGYIVQHGEYGQYFCSKYKRHTTFKSCESLYCTPVAWNITIHLLYFNLKNRNKTIECIKI